MQHGEKPLDLKILSNSELRQLEFLVRRASGEEVEKPPRVRRTASEDRALEFARYLDGLARRGIGIARRDRTPPKADEQNEIRNHIHYVLGDVADANQIYSYLAAPTAVAAPQTTAT